MSRRTLPHRMSREEEEEGWRTRAPGEGDAESDGSAGRINQWYQFNECWRVTSPLSPTEEEEETEGRDRSCDWSVSLLLLSAGFLFSSLLLLSPLYSDHWASLWPSDSQNTTNITNWLTIDYWSSLLISLNSSDLIRGGVSVWSPTRMFELELKQLMNNYQQIVNQTILITDSSSIKSHSSTQRVSDSQ